MSLKTRYNLFKIKRSLSPSTVFKASLQKELNKAWDAKYGKVSWFQTGVMYRAGAMAVAVLVLVGSGGAYAYNSPDVTEGNILYPVKKAIEKVEEVTRVTPEAKAKFLLKKIERREAERERLNGKMVELRKAEQERLSKNKFKNNDVELEQVDLVSADTENAMKLESRMLFIQKDGVVNGRIEKLNESIQATEDRLEKFNENFKITELKDVKLQEEVKNRIEKRLEKRKMKLEKTFEIMKSRNKVLEEVENKDIEIREDSSGSRDLPRLERAEERDDNN